MRTGVLIAAIVLASVSTGRGQEHEHASRAGEKLGTVQFATSCAAAAQASFDRGVALLHSFEFGSAVAAFDETLAADPSCAIAQWGIALCRWGNPFGVGVRSAAQIEEGLAAVQRGRTLRAKSERERAYIDAAAVLYVDAARTLQTTRVEGYRDAMERVAKRYPDDREAAIFFALSLVAAEDLGDKTYAGRLQAASILEPLFKAQPDHPGLAHYIIHAYDVPALAPRALDAARRYAAIAPSAAHALHMPSHVFTRVGLWQDSIDTNISAAATARRARETGEELHATDYQMYAYLQTAQDAKAKRLLDSLTEIVSRFDPAVMTSGAAPPSAGFFAAAAIPARWALERGAWAEAAALDAQPTPLPYVDAVTTFARAIGAARAGDAAGARAAVARLEALRVRESEMHEPYWTEQIEIQRRSAAAWLAFAEGRADDAVAAMRAAAEREDRTEKAAVTPGPLAPAREQLGEMLLASNDPRGALAAFDSTLVKEPGRFRALYGAACAAAAAGDAAASHAYYQRLADLCRRADAPVRRELQEARAALAR